MDSGYAPPPYPGYQQSYHSQNQDPYNYTPDPTNPFAFANNLQETLNPSAPQFLYPEPPPPYPTQPQTQHQYTNVNSGTISNAILMAQDEYYAQENFTAGLCKVITVASVVCAIATFILLPPGPLLPTLLVSMIPILIGRGLTWLVETLFDSEKIDFENLQNNRQLFDKFVSSDKNKETLANSNQFGLVIQAFQQEQNIEKHKQEKDAKIKEAVDAVNREYADKIAQETAMLNYWNERIQNAAAHGVE